MIRCTRAMNNITINQFNSRLWMLWFPVLGKHLISNCLKIQQANHGNMRMNMGAWLPCTKKHSKRSLTSRINTWTKSCRWGRELSRNERKFLNTKRSNNNNSLRSTTSRLSMTGWVTCLHQVLKTCSNIAMAPSTLWSNRTWTVSWWSSNKRFREWVRVGETASDKVCSRDNRQRHRTYHSWMWYNLTTIRKRICRTLQIF